MHRIKWLERKFNFDFPVGYLDYIIARLAGTLPRLNHLVLPLSESQLEQQYNGMWSIKVQIGHLSSTESLHEGRIDDILARKEILRPAGYKKPENIKPDYNQENIKDLLRRFEITRQRFLSRLEALDEEVQNTSSFHPRLQVMMRPVDIAFFAAEHDDHHIATIREIIKNIKL